MLNREKHKLIPILILAAVSSGCGSLGILQNLGSTIFGSAKLADASVHGVKTSECNDINAPLGEHELKVGCLMGVTKIGETEEHLVFCEQGEKYSKCKEIPLLETLTFYGQPAGIGNLWIISKIND